MANKEATIIIIDGNASMLEVEEGDENHRTKLAIALKIVETTLTTKIIKGAKGDHVGMFIVSGGYNSTSNRKYDPEEDPEAYRNITDVNYAEDLLAAGDDFDEAATPSLRMAGIGMIKLLRELEIRATSATDLPRGDVMDAIVLGLLVLNEHCRSKAKSGKGNLLKFAKKIYVFTDGQNPVSDALLDTVMAQMGLLEVEVILCAFGGFTSVAGGPNDRFEETRTILRSVVNSRNENGHFAIGLEALESLPRMMAKSVRPTTTFRGELTIGDPALGATLAIPVHLYNKTNLPKLPTAKKWSQVADNLPDAVHYNQSFGTVTSDKVFVKIEEDDFGDEVPENDVKKKEIVPEEDVTRAYRFGRNWIPFDDGDEAASKLETSKSLQIIGFTAAENIPRHMLTSPIIAIVPDESSNSSSKLLYSLMASMMEQELVALIRYVRSDGNDPKLGALMYSPKGYGYFAQIPYKDDLRKYILPPIDFLAYDIVHSKSASLSNTFPPKGREKAFAASKGSSIPLKNHHLDARKVSKHDACQAIDNLIDAMSLEGNQASGWPKNTPNPTFQRMYQCIIARSLDSDSTALPDVNEDVAKLLEPLPELKEAALPAVEMLKSAFKLELVPIKEKKGKVQRAAGGNATNGKMAVSSKQFTEEDLEFSFLFESDDDQENDAKVKKL